MARFFRPLDPNDRAALALIVAGFLCLLIASCGNDSDVAPATAAVAEREQIDPCTHKRGPEVCTTDDQGEMVCR